MDPATTFDDGTLYGDFARQEVKIDGTLVKLSLTGYRLLVRLSGSFPHSPPSS